MWLKTSANQLLTRWSDLVDKIFRKGAPHLTMVETHLLGFEKSRASTVCAIRTSTWLKAWISNIITLKNQKCFRGWEYREIYKINDNHLDFFCKMLEKCVLSFVTYQYILFNKRIIYVWNVLLVRVLFSENNTALSLLKPFNSPFSHRRSRATPPHCGAGAGFIKPISFFLRRLAPLDWRPVAARSLGTAGNHRSCVQLVLDPRLN